ncbi:unnamed protein product [Paramecium pentaurelia]|uniref:Uncharacterized protein n=1 Tax=Paramecium pentaurelia TaxID=43138 RepID=A0A8S1SPW3_9CILI|nr:unnamed protein product [Paramecium pentaurelia]
METQVIQIQLSWIDYILRKLNRCQYKQNKCSDLMKLRLQNINIKNFQELLAIYLNQIKSDYIQLRNKFSFYKNKIANHLENKEYFKVNIFEYYEEEANTIFEDKQGQLFTNKQKLSIIHVDQSFKYFKFILQIIFGLKLGLKIHLEEIDRLKNQFIKSSKIQDEIIEFLKFFVNFRDIQYQYQRIFDQCPIFRYKFMKTY